MLFKGMMPALATSTSMRPKPSTASTSAPDLASLSCSRERPASSTSVMTRRAPSLANSSAVAFPIPFAAPVTTVTFPRNLPSPRAVASVTLSPPSHPLRARRFLAFCPFVHNRSHGPPPPAIALLLIGHRCRITDEFDGQPPRRPSIDKAVALPGLRSWQWVGAGHEVHPVSAHVFHCCVQVVDVERQVLYPHVAGSGELLALVGRIELEELDIGAVGAAQEANRPDAAARGHAEPMAWGVIPGRFALVEQTAAEHTDEEGGGLLDVGHGDADVVHAA